MYYFYKKKINKIFYKKKIDKIEKNEYKIF